GLANSARRRGHYERAGALLQEALALDPEVGVTTSRFADLLDSLGLLALCRGDFETAKTSERQALAVRRELGDPWDISWSLIALGEIALREGTHPEAEVYLGEALT